MLAKRLLATAVTVCTTVAVAVIGGQAPAAAYEVSSISTSTWAYTNSHDSRSSFVNLNADAPVGRQEPETGHKFKARFYFTFDLAKVNGKKVSQAKLVVRERSVADCSAQAPLELWRTAPIGTNPTWESPPAQLEKLGAPVPGANYVCPGSLSFDLVDAVHAAQARGDAHLTLVLRIAQPDEGAKRFGRTFHHRPSLEYHANTVPTIGDVRLYFEKTCGSLAEPNFVRGIGTTLGAKTSDADPHDRLRGEFAVWPVDEPTQRQEIGGVGYGGAGNFRHELATGVYPSGTVVAWSARGYDGYDHSEWAAPCHIVIDSVAPATAPTVSSTDYPSDRNWPGYGGPGVPGTFVLDANGDPDVVRYELRDRVGRKWEVAASSPGTAVTISYTPTSSGPNLVYGTAIDRAGNRSPETRYEFLVRDTVPGVTVEMNGINLTSRLILTPTIDGVTSYRYRIDDGTEVTVPADAAGTATTELVFTELGRPTLTVASYTAAGLAGVWSGTIHVTDAPKVASSGQGGGLFPYKALVGTPLTWTFSPRSPGVVGYQYQLNWDQEVQTVDADANGVAVLDWTPTESGFWQMIVRSVHSDGTTSEWTLNLTIDIGDPRPYIESFFYNPWFPEGGVGIEGTFMVYQLLPGVTEFVLKLNDGAEFTVNANGSNTVWVDLAPDRAGENVLTAYSRFEDGTVSPTRVWTFLVAE